MAADLRYLEGKKFCVVFVKVLDVKTERVSLQCLRGRADVSAGRLNLVNESGAVFTVPSTAHANILPNDGTKLLRDADYYVLVKTDDNIEFMPPEDTCGGFAD
jgi:hypothetical protein